MITINFKEVGRGKKSWSAKVQSINHASMHRAVKANGALMSDDIEFDFETGAVIAGGFRKVGEFSVEGLPLNHALADAVAATTEGQP